MPQALQILSSPDLSSLVTKQTFAMPVCIVNIKARVPSFCPYFHLPILHRLHTSQRHEILLPLFSLSVVLAFIFSSGFVSICSPIPHSSESNHFIPYGTPFSPDSSTLSTEPCPTQPSLLPKLIRNFSPTVTIHSMTHLKAMLKQMSLATNPSKHSKRVSSCFAIS